MKTFRRNPFTGEVIVREVDAGRVQLALREFYEGGRFLKEPYADIATSDRVLVLEGYADEVD